MSTLDLVLDRGVLRVAVAYTPPPEEGSHPEFYLHPKTGEPSGVVCRAEPDHGLGARCPAGVRGPCLVPTHEGTSRRRRRPVDELHEHARAGSPRGLRRSPAALRHRRDGQKRRRDREHRRTGRTVELHRSGKGLFDRPRRPASLPLRPGPGIDRARARAQERRDRCLGDRRGHAHLHETESRARSSSRTGTVDSSSLPASTVTPRCGKTIRSS